MNTVINNPPNSGSSGNGMGFLLGIIVVGFMVFYYVSPLIRGSMGNITSQINVPGKVDINVHQTK